MPTWLNVKNNAESALVSAITASSTSLSVLPGEGAKFPSSNFHISIDDEILLCTTRTGDVFTVTRAQEGTTATAHADGAIVSLNITARVITAMQEAIDQLGGDDTMLKSVYDTDNDGIVDNAEKLEGSTKAQVQDHDPKAHKTSHAVGGVDSLFPADPEADRYLKWNNATHSMHWAEGSAIGGDMYKATYDKNEDGRVDKAEAVDDGTNSATAAEIADAVSKAHSKLLWRGAIVATQTDGDPGEALRQLQRAGNVAATPTNITATVARCSAFMLDTPITVKKIRWYGVGATTGLYHVAVYRYSDGARLAILDDFDTVAGAWGAGSFNCSLEANVLYILAVSVDTTGTVAGVACVGGTVAATTGQIAVAPQSWPGNLDIDALKVNGGFFQFAVSAGALPSTLPTLVAQAVWTGGMPVFFLDNNDA